LVEEDLAGSAGVRAAAAALAADSKKG